MPEPDDTVRLETRLDERAGFALPSDYTFPATQDAQPGQPNAPPDAIAWTPRGVSIHAPIPLIRERARLRLMLRDAVSAEWERGTAFLFIPVVLAAGALTYFAIGQEPGFIGIGASVSIAGFLVWLARTRLVLHLLLASALCFALGMLFAKVETWRAGTKMLGGEISTRLTGRVAVIEHLASGRVRLTLDVTDTERPHLKYAPERVRVSARAVPANLQAGDLVSGVARLLPPSGPTRPGGYDFAFESYFDGIGANGFFLKPVERLADAAQPAAGAHFLAMVENLRTALAERIRTAIDGNAEGEIAAALIAGVRAGIPEDVNEALRRTGLAHVLSISGLHMALVAATIMVVLRAGLALLPGFASRRPVKKYAAGAALLALAVYLFISGSAVAAERSFIMIGVMLLAVMFDRQALTMRNLAISAIVIIAVSPHEVAGPSFQMSFAATAALIGTYAAWSERRRRAAPPPEAGQGLSGRSLRMAGGYVLGLAATSLIAGTATAIFGAYHFQRVSPLGLAANLAAMPIVSVLVMPFALIGMLLMPFGLDQWAFAVMGKGLTAMIAVAEWFSQMSPVDAVGLVPESAVILLTVALVLATLPTTWLRLAAVPFLTAGLSVMAMRSLPDALISEDGRLLAVRSGDGAIATNRARPSAFTMKDWQRALKAGTIQKPKNAAAGASAQPASGNGFVCSGEACEIRLPADALLAYAASALSAQPLCATATLIVVDDAAAENVCRDGEAMIVTKRDLARQGSAWLDFSSEAGKPVAEVTFAVHEPYRPWHAHRAFSREARGLAPYKGRKSTDSADRNPLSDDPPIGAASGRHPHLNIDGSTRPGDPAP